MGVQELTATELWDQIESQGVAKTLAGYRKTVLATRTLISLFEEYDQRDAHRFLASYPTVPSLLAEQLVERFSEDHEILSALVQNPRAPSPFLIQIAESGADPVKQSLAERAQLGVREMTLLMSGAPSVRAALARNPVLSTHWQALLSRDADVSVRAALAQNKKLAEPVSFTLLQDADVWVRTVLLSEGALSEEVLQYVADTGYELEQSLLIGRRRLSDDVLHALRLSVYPHVRELAFSVGEPTPPEIISLIESDDPEDRYGLAQSSELPIALQRLLAQDSSAEVRNVLAANPALEPAIALHIAMAGDESACAILAGNANLPDAALSELCESDSEWVSEHVAGRVGLSDEHIARLLQPQVCFPVVRQLALGGYRAPALAPDEVLELIESRAASLRQFAASSPALTSHQCLDLMRDPAPMVRTALRENPVLPNELRSQMDEF